ncbi:AbrB family transcriptional regulator [Robbsia sp. KACC 23696]|uniref:AbrB family transcriptional regulator n=1 Tax=Robbsia sp. KACC 23696 TaxID=3149231 RepID=UPI00325B7B29
MPAQWATLLALSAIVSWLMMRAGLSASLLLGPLVAGIALATQRAAIKVPKIPFYTAQGVVGSMIATKVPPTIFIEIGKHWEMFTLAVLSVLLASCLLGYLLGRLQVLPNTTAIWGSFPGAATAMTLMAGSFGADTRLVAFMAYLRVVVVAVVASAVARYSLHVSSTHDIVHVLPSPVWFPPLQWEWLAATLAIVAVGIMIGLRFRIPAGPLLIPMALSIVLSHAGLVEITLPYWLLAASYALVGWTIGLRFTREVVSHAASAFPRVLLSTLALVACCGGFAAILVKVSGVDPLTAYLAMSPGGADSVAIIAAGAPNVDMPFVMSLQMARFLTVVLFGPAIARWMARSLQRSLVRKADRKAKRADAERRQAR